MVHLYCGEGKGKTTAAMGLALRMAGRGKRVVVAQFLKGADSGERYALAMLPQVTLLPLPERVKFSFQLTPEEREAEQASGALDWAAVSPCLDDAVLFLDEEDRVCGFNPAATALYRRMGYIGTLAGMPVNNIQPAALSECDQDRHETALANRVLQYQRLPLSSGQARAALIIHDLTRQRQLEEELGVTLFDRGSRAIRLTEAGRLFYNRAVSILEMTKAARKELKQLEDGLLGTLRLGMISSVETQGIITDRKSVV